MTRSRKEIAATLASIFANPAGFSFPMAHPVRGETWTIHTMVEYAGVQPPDDDALAGRVMETLMLMACGIVESPLQKSSNAELSEDEPEAPARFGGPAQTSTADITRHLNGTETGIRFEDVHRLLGALSHSAVHIKVTSPTQDYSTTRYPSFLALEGIIVASDAVIVLEYELNGVLWNIVQI